MVRFRCKVVKLKCCKVKDLFFYCKAVMLMGISCKQHFNFTTFKHFNRAKPHKMKTEAYSCEYLPFPVLCLTVVRQKHQVLCTLTNLAFGRLPFRVSDFCQDHCLLCDTPKNIVALQYLFKFYSFSATFVSSFL